jgi:acetyltransferase-like isoleucine patch superfamily enzyme
MIGKTVILQLVNLFFSITPLARWYQLRARLLRIAGVDCHPSARIVSSCRIVTLNVAIGEDTFIGHQVLISGTETAKITIGNHVDIAPRVVILGGTTKIDTQGAHSAGVGKGEPVWVGGNSTIAPGATVGRKSIIGAGSVVVSDIPPFCIAVGNPCSPIKKWSLATNTFDRIE